jgi:MFS family permease
VLSTYKKVLRKPGAFKTLGFGMVGRIPLAMNPVAIILLISSTKDSFAEAGLASGAYTLAGALVGPRIGRLADRFGSRKVLFPITLIHIASMLWLIKVSHGALIWIMIAGALTGATLANIGSYTRTRWSRALTDRKELTTALSIESVLDEISFVGGPALAGLLFVQFSPSFAPLAGLALLVLGAAGLGLSSSHHDISANPEKRQSGLLGIFMVKPLLISLVALGCVFGGNTVAILGVAKETGNESQGGLLVALYSLGSLVAGTLYGMHHWKSLPSVRYFYALAFMTTATLGPVFIHSYGVLAYLVMLSGAAISPTLIAANALLKELVPSDRLNEAFSFIGAAISIGITIGSAVAGAIVESHRGWSGFYFVILSSLLATGIALFGLFRKDAGMPHESEVIE